VREIRTLRAMWRGLETTHGSDTEALSTETESKQSRPNLRSLGASPRPYRGRQAAPGEHLDSKEIDACQNSHMRTDEAGPGRLLPALRSGSNTEPAQDGTYCLIRNAMTEVLQRSGDAIVTPAAILASHPDDQFCNLAADRGPSRVAAMFGTIEFACYQLAIPGQDGLRFRN